MSIADVIIILAILMGAVVGFKRGLTTQLVSTIGIILVIVLAFILKNPVSKFMYENLPFFDFGGLLKGLPVLNIFVYELIAFILVLSILAILLKLLLKVTKIFEFLLKLTVVLSIPSKIGGAIVGMIENFIFVFIVLYILNLPIFDFSINSKYQDKILNNTPILSQMVDKSVKVIDEFSDLKEKYEKEDNSNEFNRETLELFLKYDVIDVDAVETLVKKDKLKIKNADEIIKKYKEA